MFLDECAVQFLVTNHDHILCLCYRLVYEAPYKCKLLLIQCELANENTELLDSVRFIIQRESEAAQEREHTPTHTILLLNIPRGHTFTGSQGVVA